MSDHAMEIPAIPDFNPKMVRRATRRGLLRVAVIAALIVGAAFAVVDFGSGWLARRHDNGARTQQAVEGAMIAHPGYAQYLSQDSSGHRNSISRTGDYSGTVTLAEVGPTGQPGATTEVHTNRPLFGDFSVNGIVVPSKLEDAIRNARPGKDATRRVLSGLPDSVAASAIVEFTAPLDQKAADTAMKQMGVKVGTDAPPTAQAVETDNGEYLFTPLHTRNPGQPIEAEPNTYFDMLGSPLVSEQLFASNATTAIREYADHVHHADDHWLKQLGLPGSDQLKQIAQDGKIYGFVWNGASPAQLKALLERADVRSVAISDAVFNVSG
jgi:hypothetical protein